MSAKPGKFRLLFSELQRRKVTRLATIYIVIGLGVIETMDIIGGRFQIPEGAIRLLILLVIGGFPVAMILGWIYDLTSRGIERTKPLTREEKTALPSFTWKPSWVSVVLFAILILLSFAFFTVPRPNALGFKERDWVLIAELENNTEDEVFNKSLMHALSITIDQSRHVSIFPRQKVREALQRMKVEDTEKIDSPTALEIAQRENIKAVLLLTISELGGRYILSTSLLDSNSGESIRSRQATAQDREDILHALNKLAKSIRKDLGESLQKIQRSGIPLSQATTSSLEALKYHSQAKEASGGRNYDKAEELLLKAIELDPEFALAHADLGSIYYTTNQRVKGEEHFTIALDLMDRLTEREKLWIDALVAEERGNRDAAILKFEIFLNKFPNDPSGWFRLGYNLMRLKYFEESIEAFTRSQEFFQYKEASVYINIASCYGNLRDYQKSIESYLEAFEIAPSNLLFSNLNHEFGFTYAQLGDLQSAREVFEKMIAGTDSQKAFGYRSLALLSTYSGNFAMAIKQIHESIVLFNSLGGYDVSELRSRLYLAFMYRSRGMMAEFYKELNNARGLIRPTTDMDPWWLLILGKLSVRNGDLENAEINLNQISNSVNEGNRSDEAAYTILKGEIEMVKGNYSEALDLFETSIILRNDGYTLESLANCYHRTGDFENAISRYEEIITIRSSIGWEAQEYWIQAHYILGTIYEEMGNKEKASEYYTTFLEIWKDADEDLPELIEARSRLANL